MRDSSRFERDKLKRKGLCQDCKIKLHRFDSDPDPDPHPTASFTHVSKVRKLAFFSQQCHFTLFYLSRQRCKGNNFGIFWTAYYKFLEKVGYS